MSYAKYTFLPKMFSAKSISAQIMYFAKNAHLSAKVRFISYSPQKNIFYRFKLFFTTTSENAAP